jgi:hypothetical protein
MGEILITQLRKTNTFPQVWEGMTDDGNFVVIKYRTGTLSFGCGVTKDDAMRGNGLEYTTHLGDEGIMETDRMKGILGPLIRFDT